MIRRLIYPDLQNIPEQFHSLLENSDIYDSSCASDATVYFLDKNEGFYLKKAPKYSLEKEAAMCSFFHSKGLAPEVLCYESLEQDWLLTRKATGEDCTFPVYMQDPKRLCDTTAELLRMLHDTNPANCPVSNRTQEYLDYARKNFAAGYYDITLFPDNWGYRSPEEAWDVIVKTGDLLKTDTLLHGDFCLPNIILDDWHFSSFIDLGAAGVGDKHVDLFWAVWSLQFNLKTDAYRERFLDAYGRNHIEPELFRTVAAIEVFT